MLNSNTFNCVDMPNNLFPASFVTADTSSSAIGGGDGARQTKLFHIGDVESFGVAQIVTPTHSSHTSLPSFHQNYQNHRLSAAPSSSISNSINNDGINVNNCSGAESPPSLSSSPNKMPMNFCLTLREYLTQPSRYDCVLTIFHTKVAQKSYNNEKRYFTPPPCIYLTGDGWAIRRDRIEKSVKKDNAQLKVDLTAFISLGDEQRFKIDFPSGKDFDSARNLFVSDKCKFKYFHLSTKLVYSIGEVTLKADGVDALIGPSAFNNSSSGDNTSQPLSRIHFYSNVGDFQSHRIKIISKPTKKRQSIKATDCKFLCVTSGTKVALYNRTRSQTGSTRYLFYDESRGDYVASQTKWGAFSIHIVNIALSKECKVSADCTTFDVKDGTVYYGAVVKLVDCVSRVTLPAMRVLKAEKELIDIDPKPEPVSQMHRCVFQLCSDPHQYFSLQNDAVGYVDARERVVDGRQYHAHIDSITQWSVVSVEMLSYRFYEPSGISTQVAPVPILTAMQVDASESERAYLTLQGINMKPAALTVYLGTTPLETCATGADCLTCILPPLGDLDTHPPSMRLVNNDDYNGVYQFPLTLVRQGDTPVIYGTPTSVEYAKPRAHTVADDDPRLMAMSRPILTNDCVRRLDGSTFI